MRATWYLLPTLLLLTVLTRAHGEDGKENWRRPEILREYLAQQAKKMSDRKEVEDRFGKPFHEFNNEEYAELMKEFDFSKDEDIFRWSHVVDIPVLAIDAGSNMFYSNSHLMQDVAAARKQNYEQMWDKKTIIDKETGEIRLTTKKGVPIPTRKIPIQTLLPVAKTDGFNHIKDFDTYRITYQALEPYLIRLSEVSYRAAFDQFIRSLPRSVVQFCRGRGLYFVNRGGSSYATAMTYSNHIGRYFAGLQSGSFIELRRDGPQGTAQNFVHELGHIADYGMLKGGYGAWRHPEQFPEVRKLRAEQQHVFGVGDDKVPQTPYGYISGYSRVNAQESFAEHWRAYITENEKFRKQAEKELADGHPELMRKYAFMRKLIDETPTTMVRLSAEYLAKEKGRMEYTRKMARVLRVGAVLREDNPESFKQLKRKLEAGEEIADFDGQLKAISSAIHTQIAALPDGRKKHQALAAHLGVSLTTTFKQGCPSAKPVLVATIEGAREAGVTGEVFVATGLGDDTRAPVVFEIEPGKKKSVELDVSTGDDLAPISVLMTAKLTCGEDRFTLTQTVTCRPTIPCWSVVGPFDNPGGEKENVEHPPETEAVDLTKTYAGKDGETVAWKETRRASASEAGSDFRVNFSELLGVHENVAAYAVAYVHVPRATPAELSYGAADGTVIWVNGERKHTWLKGRRDYRRRNKVPMELKAGANEILVKITLASRGWYFGAHLTGADGKPIPEIRYSPKP